jgi:hypothetical protein
MKLNRHILLFALLSVFSIACDETKDFLEDLNDAPQIGFTSNPDAPILVDSIKIGPFTSQEKYSIVLRVTDRNSNINEVLYTQLAGRGVLIQDDTEVVSNNISFEKDSSVLEFDYYPEVLGLHELGLRVSDRFGLSNSVSIQIISFDNLLPVAVFNFSRLGSRDRNEYVINAGESFDRDAKYGGTVVEYEFTVLGKVYRLLATTDSSIRIIFQAKGVFPVAVRVRDNDGKWSSYVEKEIVVD